MFKILVIVKGPTVNGSSIHSNVIDFDSLYDATKAYEKLEHASRQLRSYIIELVKLY